MAGVALSVAIGLVGGFAAGEGALPAAEDVSDRPSFAGASDRAAAAGAPPVLPGAVWAGRGASCCGTPLGLACMGVDGGRGVYGVPPPGGGAGRTYPFGDRM